MRWFRRGADKQESDPAQARALVDDVRARYGGQVQATFEQQSDACTAQLNGVEEGLAAAVAIVHEFAETAFADMHAQAARLGWAPDRRNYRPLWQHGRGNLRWNLFALPGHLHPYIQLTAAVTVIGAQAKAAARRPDHLPLLAHLFEILDLTVAGWEFARVRPDTDMATLAVRLITTARDVRAAMSDEPPLPDPVRELMRRNNTIDVYDPQTPQVVGALNPGKEMREALLA